MVFAFEKPIAVNCWNDDQGWSKKEIYVHCVSLVVKVSLLKCRIEEGMAEISFYDSSNKEDGR